MKCNRCGGLIIDDQWNLGKKKCVNCGREPKPIEGKSIQEEATMTNEKTAAGVDEVAKVIRKNCTKCEKPYPATNEYFSKNATTKDGLEHWCKNCKKKQQADYRKKKKEADLKIGTKSKGGNGNNHKSREIKNIKPIDNGRSRQLEAVVSRLKPMVIVPSRSVELFMALRRAFAEEAIEAIRNHFGGKSCNPVATVKDPKSARSDT